MTLDVSEEKSGISAGTLKIIAVVTMLIDHIAAAVLVRHFYATDDWGLYTLYYAMRQIGRIAFPIYCFMLVEGLERTHSRGKYLARMLGFALISEIPFDLAFSSQVFELGYQNVFFTLSIALAAMMAMELIQEKIKHPLWQSGVFLLVGAGSMVLAAVLQTDYDWRGVACILLMYFWRRNRTAELIVGYVAFVFLLGEITALPAFIALAFYRGRKGFSCKPLFYGFYPIHLLLLYGLCVVMGIAEFSAV